MDLETSTQFVGDDEYGFEGYYAEAPPVAEGDEAMTDQGEAGEF